MNRNEMISAMLDGELGEQELKSILGSLTEEEHVAWDDFSLVGDLMRSSDMARFDSANLLDRIEASIAAEPTVLAPVLATKSARENLVARVLKSSQPRRLIASVAAVGFFSFVLNQAVPPLDTQVQIVRKQPVENTVTDQDLALWQEYFMAHQQNSMRSGLSGVSPIARVESDRAMIDRTERVVVDNLAGADWMNVWEPATAQYDSGVQYNFVSSGR